MLFFGIVTPSALYGNVVRITSSPPLRLSVICFTAWPVMYVEICVICFHMPPSQLSANMRTSAEMTIMMIKPMLTSKAPFIIIEWLSAYKKFNQKLRRPFMRLFLISGAK
jgi:hypothetical protein